VAKIYKDIQRARGGLTEDGFDGKGEMEAIETPVSQLGDIWLLGRHRLMCGDSTDIGQVARLMDGAKAHMVFTDPPWNVNYGSGDHPSWKKRSIMNDNMSTDAFYDFLLKAFKAMASVSLPGAMTYIVMSAQEWGSAMLAMREAGYHWSSTIIWAKDRFVLAQKDYNTQYEPIWYGWLAGEKRLCPVGDDTQSDLWQFDRPMRSPLHPTTKPVALAGKAIIKHVRSAWSAAIKVVPEPPKRSSTLSPGCEEFMMAFPASATGLVVGCSGERMGRSNCHRSDCVSSPTGHSRFSPASQPYQIGSYCVL
jgi:hypothetical protein